MSPGSLDGGNCLREINRAIKSFSADMSELTVLTEAGSKYYVFTPLIAALADAAEVLVICRDSRFGLRRDILENLMEWAEWCGVGDRLTILNDRRDPRVGRADVVTNLGFVRPIDADMIDQLPGTAAISLMWETWEYREQDLDLQFARARGIPVLGTNESDSRLRTMEYVGVSALKALLNCGIAVLGSKLLVVGGGAFAAACRDVLERLGANVTFVNSCSDNYANAATLNAADQDAIIVAEHQSRSMLVGRNGLDLAGLLPSQRPALIVHIAGNIDKKHCEDCQVFLFPDLIAPNGYMSLATDTVGPKPVLALHTAGLAIGGHLSRRAVEGLRGLEAERATLAALPFAQGFADRH